MIKEYSLTELHFCIEYGYVFFIGKTRHKENSKSSWVCVFLYIVCIEYNRKAIRSTNRKGIFCIIIPFLFQRNVLFSSVRILHKYIIILAYWHEKSNLTVLHVFAKRWRTNKNKILNQCFSKLIEFDSNYQAYDFKRCEQSLTKQTIFNRAVGAKKSDDNLQCYHILLMN